MLINWNFHSGCNFNSHIEIYLENFPVSIHYTLPYPQKCFLSRVDGMEIVESSHLCVEERVRLVFTHLNLYFRSKTSFLYVPTFI